MKIKMKMIYGLKFGTPGSLKRDEICLQINDATNIIHVSHGGHQICQLVLRLDGFVDMVSPCGDWIIPVGYSHPILHHFVGNFEFKTLLSLASYANMCNVLD